MSAFTLGLVQGFISCDHRVPKKSKVLHSKYCENCGKTMFVVNGQRYCKPCGNTFLAPINLESLVAIAPAHSHVLSNQPHYDVQ